MSCSIVIPVRPPEEGKSRLADTLAVDDRALLVERMFCHVLGVAIEAVGADLVYVISRSPMLLAYAQKHGCRAIEEAATGLNHALEHVAAVAPAGRPLLALSADLPLLQCSDLTAMIDELRQSEVVVATDRAGVGTNALLLARPGLLPYSFGADSRALHEHIAFTKSLRCAVISRSGLAADLDLPGDLALLDGA